MPDKNDQEKKLVEQSEAPGSSGEQGGRKEGRFEFEVDQEQSQEKKQEQISETEPSREKEDTSAPEKEESYSSSGAQASADSAEEREQQIEKILEKDLVDSYLNLEPEKQKEFKKKGEETARRINELLNKTKVKTKKVVDLIKKWLSILPGINKFFLEQEAKKKAEEIIKLKQK